MFQRSRGQDSLRRVRKLSRLLRNAEYRRGLRRGVAATVEHEAVAFRSDIHSVIDVGANRGQFALLARHRFPNASIECFEPLPSEAGVIRQLFRADEGLRIHETALSDVAGTATFHVSRQRDSSSLLPIGTGQVASFPQTAEEESLQVQVMRLDDLPELRSLRRPTLLKIDVQGAELQVLRGAVSVLTKVDELYVECSFVELYEGQALASEVVDFLAARAFVLAGVYNPIYSASGEALQADFHFRASN